MLRTRRHAGRRLQSLFPDRRLQLEPLEERVLLTGDIHTIQHVIVIMQENRSFDSYFGTYPGVDGLPMKNGVPVASILDPATGKYVTSFHDPNFRNIGGPHENMSAITDINGGKMDGFFRAYNAFVQYKGITADLMGYHDGREIPNYWSYADNFVLQDRMFSPAPSWSLPVHQLLVSAWAATSPNPYDPMSSVTNLRPPYPPTSPGPTYAWTDLTYLLHKYNVSWAYYTAGHNEVLDPGDAGDAGATTPAIWNPLPYFTDVYQDNQLANVQDASNYFKAAAAGTLPAVSWVMPNARDSEHPSSLVNDGQAWVTSVVNAAMKSPDWGSTAIFLSWDDWGGFYDHVVPPTIGGNQFGLRVPGIVISPWAKKGYIDHQTLSFDAYLKFIEDDFMGGQRLDPKNDGRPDSRPNVRENAAGLGNLLNDFDFSQAPRSPLILAERPNSPNSNPGGPYTINPGDSLTLDGSATFNLQGKPMLYSWDVNGDSNFRDAVGVKPILSWQKLVSLGIKPGGTYRVRLLTWESLTNFTYSQSVLLTVGLPVQPTIAAANLELVAGSLFTGVVGGFTNPTSDASVANYSSVINWGDGNSSAGQVAAQNGGHFDVSGSHAYSKVGNYHITVTLRHGATTLTALSSAHISSPPPPPSNPGTETTSVPIGDGTSQSPPAANNPGTSGTTGQPVASAPPPNTSQSTPPPSSILDAAAAIHAPDTTTTAPVASSPPAVISAAASPPPAPVMAPPVSVTTGTVAAFRGPQVPGTLSSTANSSAIVNSTAPSALISQAPVKNSAFNGVVAAFRNPNVDSAVAVSPVALSGLRLQRLSIGGSFFIVDLLPALVALLSEPASAAFAGPAAIGKAFRQRAVAPTFSPTAAGGHAKPDELLPPPAAVRGAGDATVDIEDILLGTPDVTRRANLLDLDAYFRLWDRPSTPNPVPNQ